MSMPARLVLTPGLNEIVEHSPGVHEAVETKAEKALAYAQAIAPVLTGAFRDSLHIEGEGDAVNVVASSVDDQGRPDAAYIEFGTSDTPAHGTLRQALEAAANG